MHTPADLQMDWHRAYQERQRRWRTDRKALIAEHTTRCTYCDRDLPPRVLGLDGREWTAGAVFLVRAERCGCAREQAAWAARQEAEERARKERRCAAWASALERAGLVGWLARASFDTYKPDTAQGAASLSVCRQYTHALLAGKLGDKPWLVLYGPYGTGKTHLAAAIVREALGNGWTDCFFRAWLAYLRRLLDSFDGEAQERTADVARELAAGRLVAIDDIDNDRASVSQSGFAETELFRALDDRYRAALPTILTFNRHPLDMTPWLGAAGVDRVLHYSYAAVELRGESYRSGQLWTVP